MRKGESRLGNIHGLRYALLVTKTVTIAINVETKPKDRAIVSLVETNTVNVLLGKAERAWVDERISKLDEQNKFD